MERLTTWRSDNRAAIANNDEATPLQQTMKIPAVVDRLAAIEDILGDDYDLDRLRELVEADRDGRCVVPPCKVGDIIYKLFCGGAVKLEVERIVCWSSGFWKVNAHTDRKYIDWKGFEIDFSNFGKTVFLTREAAEAALKGEQDGGQHD